MSVNNILYIKFLLLTTEMSLGIQCSQIVRTLPQTIVRIFSRGVVVDEAHDMDYSVQCTILLMTTPRTVMWLLRAMLVVGLGHTKFLFCDLWTYGK